MKLKPLYRLTILAIIILCGNYLHANPYIDSLKNVLKSCPNAKDSVIILCQITWNLGDIDKVETKRYGLLALTTAKRLNDSTIIADAYDATAKGYLLNRDIENAKKNYVFSLQIGLRNNIKYRIAWGYYNLASIAIIENNINDAVILAKKSHRYFEQIGSHEEAINSYWLLIKANRNEFIEPQIQSIKRYIEKNQADDSKLLYYLQLAGLYNIQENRKKAMYYVQLAMESADKNKNIKVINKAYYQIADYFKNYQNNYPLALTYVKKILELQADTNSIQAGNLFIDIGNLYRLMKNDSLALFYIDKGLENGRKNKHRHTMASAYMNLGELNYQQKHFNNALFYYLKCYETGCDICPQIKFHDALVNIGNVYLFSNDTRNALIYYSKSLALADSFSDRKAQITSYRSFAGLYEKQGEWDQAIKYYEKAFLLSREAGFLEGQQLNAAKLGYLYKNQNNFHKAFEYLNVSNELSDSLNKINQAENLAKLETYFDFKNLQVQRQLEKSGADKEIARQKSLRNVFITGIFIAVIFGIFFFLGFRRKKKDNLLLNQQKLEIENMSKKVHDADQAKLHFFTDVSHELRTPLTLIMGMTEKLKTNLQENQHVHIIRKNSLKLLQLINHLLDLRKLDESKMKLNVSQGNLIDFMKGMMSSFEEYARQKDVILEFYPDEKEITGYFDHDKLEKIISNLISNAIKYNRANGHVKISAVNVNDGSVKIEINDNGIGISEKELKNIFGRFYRVSENNVHGSGIGLALVKELVELHKGEINVSSSMNDGTSFIVKIPLAKHFFTEDEIVFNEHEAFSWDYSEALDSEDETIVERSAGKPGSDKKTILIVEDNNDLRKFIAELFTDEYEVIEAQNGEEGFEKSQEYIPDMIISDIMMPKLSGIQLVDKIKNDVTTSHIPVILLTAKNDIGTRLSGYEKGADDYISKPFESAVLKSRVENLLRLRKQLVEIFSKQFHLQPKEIIIEDADKKFLEKIIDIIEKNISNPNLNIDFLAKESCVSRTQLYRKLKALTDYSANQFIRIIRLKRAAQILQQGQNNIAEVMDATGFNNYSYFNNCFKEYFGEFPKDYALLSVKGIMN